MLDYDLYKVDTETLEDGRALLERVLSRKFVKHDSSFYRGPYYASGKLGGEHFKLIFNMDAYENVPNESQFPEAKWILYVNETERSEELRHILSETGVCSLLRHRSR